MKKYHLLSTLLAFTILITPNIAVKAQDGTNNVALRQNPSAFSLYANKSFISRKYILAPNDVISIDVFGVPELSQKPLRIQPDGRINVMPIGSLKVAGLTLDELTKLATEKYGYYLKNPVISVNITQTRPFVAYVTGAVLNPGSYELNTDTGTVQFLSNVKPEVQIERKTPILSNILVAAGGLSYDADLEHIQITNSIDNTKIEVNLLELLDNGDSNQDIYLTAGDTIFVPRLPTPLAVNEAKYKKYAGSTFSPREIPVKVIGYVNNPGLVKLESAQSLNLNSAISAAGGYLKDSAYAPGKVYLSRVDTSGKLVTRVVNPMSNDLTVMPNDIVYVPEKPRPLIGKAFDYTSRLITPAMLFATTYNGWAEMFNPDRNYRP